MFKMAGCNSHKTPNMYRNLNATLSSEQQFRSNKINEIKDYFIAEVKERELMSKRFSKCIASFDYFHKSLVVLSVGTGSISAASLANIIGVPLGMGSASFSLTCSIKTRIVKKKTVKNNKK